MPKKLRGPSEGPPIAFVIRGPAPTRGVASPCSLFLPSAFAYAELRSDYLAADARLPKAFESPAADTPTTSERSVFPQRDAPETQGGARVGHALQIVLPGQGAGPPEVAARNRRLVVSAADKEGEAGAQAARLGVRCSNLARLEAETACCRAVG